MSELAKEKGMSGLLSDEDFFRLLTRGGTENIELVVKYYPELAIYVKIDSNK